MKLVLLRHGESMWNKTNQFAGWADIDLSERGIIEARRAGYAIAAANIRIDVAFTSALRRAIKTLWVTIEEANQMWIPTKSTWRLNERHYGALQGLNRRDAALQYGEHQLQLWRRTFNAKPPPLEGSATDINAEVDRRHTDLRRIPKAESLRDTEDRLLPFWESDIAPELLKGANVLVVAHGNSLRVLRKIIEDLSEPDACSLQIGTGQVHVFELDETLKVKSHYGIPV